MTSLLIYLSYVPVSNLISWALWEKMISLWCKWSWVKLKIKFEDEFKTFGFSKMMMDGSKETYWVMHYNSVIGITSPMSISFLITKSNRNNFHRLSKTWLTSSISEFTKVIKKINSMESKTQILLILLKNMNIIIQTGKLQIYSSRLKILIILKKPDLSYMKDIN